MSTVSGIGSVPSLLRGLPSGSAHGSGFADAARSARVGAAKDPRDAAEELVAITLVQPVLAQMRESSFAAEPFAPTDAEKRFGAQYDAAIARQIVRSGRFPLVDQLARQMRMRSESAGLSTGAEAADHEPVDYTA